MTNVALGTFYVIAPVLVIVGMGYLAGKLGWIKDVAVDSLTKIVFYVGLPALLIDEISRADLSTFIRMKGPLVVVVVAVIMGILGYVTALLFKVSADKRGVWAQASFRANMGFVGLPVVMNALGETGIHYCSLVLAVGVPTFNILSVIVLFLPQRGEGGKIPLAKMVGGVLRNPLVIACVIGFLFSFVRPDKLKILDVSLFHLKHLPLPLALLAIGAKLDVRRSIELLKETYMPLIYKLFLTPLLGGFVLYALYDFSLNPVVSSPDPVMRHDFVSTILLLASPVAVVSYIMAYEMKGDSDLAANLILSTTFFSFISFSLILFVLGALGIWIPR